MKIIFLDIDGVLNSVDTAIAFFRLKPHTTNEDRLDQVSIELLRRIVEVTGAGIVVSSTWRLGRTKEDFQEIFSVYGWEDFPYIGQTEVIRSPGICRGHEIQKWIDDHKINHDDYIILDDDSDMLESQKDRFIHVSNVNGLRSKHYCAAIRLFGHPDERLESQVNWVKQKS